MRERGSWEGIREQAGRIAGVTVARVCFCHVMEREECDRIEGGMYVGILVVRVCKVRKWK
jgi:hypothetical protein